MPRILGEHFRADGSPKTGYKELEAKRLAADREMVAYECTVCGRWHLATAAEEPSRRRGKRK
jgi:hypothetical protein